VARAVPAAPSSSLVLPPGCFVVPYNNASMYGKKMRDVHMAGFSVQNNSVIRFRSSDCKVAVGDLLVGVGRFARFSEAQDIIFKLLERKDDKIDNLPSLEVDKDLADKVGHSILINIFILVQKNI